MSAVKTWVSVALAVACGGLCAADVNAPAAIRHRQEVRRSADDPEKGRAVLEAALKDEDPYVRRFAEARLGRLKAVKPPHAYRVNVPLTQNPVNDHPMTLVHSCEGEPDGSFVLPAKPDVGETRMLEVELSFGRVTDTLYVWVNGVYVGQYLDRVNQKGLDFKLDVTAEAKWGGERNAVTVKNAAGKTLARKTKVEVFACGRF